jgi:hypothetical protein
MRQKLPLIRVGMRVHSDASSLSPTLNDDVLIEILATPFALKKQKAI